ncbi:MAG: hypothetical protein JXR84_11515 [Anaerolineae bacterium]|nr:hypothetical protein [Anaerolineae bacterium]
MKQRMVLLIVTVMLMTALGCSLFSGGGTSDGGATSSGDFEIKVVNESPDEICYVLISSSESDQWGEDWLGGDETIASGDSKTFTVSAGEHDIQLEGCDEAVLETGWFIDDDTTVTVGDSRATSRLFVDNTSDTEACYIFISPSSGDEWGDDQMGENETIMPGRTRIFYVRPGIYDLMASDCDDNTMAEQYEVDLSSDQTWTLYNE